MKEPMFDQDTVDCHRSGTSLFKSGFKKTCKECRDKCGLWMKMTRTDPRTGGKIDQWMCGDIWNVVLQTEIIQHLEGVQQATESFRNEVVDRSDRGKNV